MKVLAKSSYIYLLFEEMGLVTDAQRTELDDAAFEYRVRAKGIQARRDIKTRAEARGFLFEDAFMDADTIERWIIPSLAVVKTERGM